MLIPMQEYPDEEEKIGGEIAPAKDVLLPEESNEAPAQRLMRLGREIANLGNLLTSASFENKDADHRSWALGVIIDKFGSKPKERRVHLPPEIIDRYGGDADAIRFGVRDIYSDSDRENLEQEAAVAQKYFADMGLHFITDRKGNRLGLVVGIDARHFNAVVSAERHKRALAKAIDEARKQLGLQPLPKDTLDNKVFNYEVFISEQGKGRG